MTPGEKRKVRRRWGPGRPRRAVEEDYLAALSDQLSIERWENIVSKAIEDAENGDHRARDWIARYALGPSPKVAEMGLQGALRLFQLAVDEAREKTVEEKIENRVANDRLLESSYGSLLSRY